MTSIDLSPASKHKPHTSPADPQWTMLAYLYFIVGTILLCMSPALVIAVWQWAL